MMCKRFLKRKSKKTSEDEAQYEHMPEDPWELN
jgi:hypothetical protein